MSFDAFPVVKELYSFECTQCGNCCSGNQTVELNPYDLYCMARFLNLSNTADLFEQGWVHLQKSQNEAWLPQIRFRDKPFRFCPFLINEADDQFVLKGLCRLHPDHKPLVCSLSPLARQLDFVEDTKVFRLVPPASDCPGMDRKKENRLSEMLKSHENALQYQRTFFRWLDELKPYGYNREWYFSSLYRFDISPPFAAIISHLEISVRQAAIKR